MEPKPNQINCLLKKKRKEKAYIFQENQTLKNRILKILEMQPKAREQASTRGKALALHAAYPDSNPRNQEQLPLCTATLKQRVKNRPSPLLSWPTPNPKMQSNLCGIQW